MPAHRKAYERLYRDIARATTRDAQDWRLDQILAIQQLATEWDADQWGFDPDRWMETERVVLASRGGCDWPTEAV